MRLRWVLPIAALVVQASIFSGVAASSVSTSSVLRAVKESVSIKVLPSGLTPSLTTASNNQYSAKTSGANYIKPTCNPYWKHAQATKPVPCIYGDKSSKRTVVLYGDSNAGDWAPALSTMMAGLHIRLALFGFFGCTTAPVTETATSQPGFPGQWQLCNEWHASLPVSVRKLHPVAIISAASPWGVDASESADWVGAMKLDFEEMTLGNPTAKRIVIEASPLYPQSNPECLSSYPTDVQKCSVNYSAPGSEYSNIILRDETVAQKSGAVLISTEQFFCYAYQCSPVVGKYLVCIDRDHTSTAYVQYIEGALRSEILKLVKLP